MDLREYLFRHRIKQQDFCKKVGISHKTLYLIINGKADIKLSTFRKIKAATDGQVKEEDIVIAETATDIAP